MPRGNQLARQWCLLHVKPFWPLLVFGQWTHAGSNTTFGLGGCRVEPPHAERIGGS